MHPSAEMPLIAFTLLTQLAIGIMLVSPILLWHCHNEKVSETLISQRKTALIFLCIGAFLSVLHLGTMFHSPFTIFNIASSWLSREIIMVVLTTLALGGSVWLYWKKNDFARANRLFRISIGLGLVLLYVMSKVYNTPLVPSWAGTHIFFLFLATSLLLGSLYLGAIIGCKLPLEPAKTVPFLWKTFFTAIAGLILVALCSPHSLAFNDPYVNPLTVAYSTETVAYWRAFHALLCGIAVLLLAIALFKSLRGTRAASWLFVALACGICGEIIGRCAFYMSYARLGI